MFRRKQWKHITFTSVIWKEVTRIDKNGEEVTKNISYKLQFNHSARVMASSLSNLVNSFFKRIRKIKCKYGYDDNFGEIDITIATVFLNTQTIKMI